MKNLLFIIIAFFTITCSKTNNSSSIKLKVKSKSFTLINTEKSIFNNKFIITGVVSDNSDIKYKLAQMDENTIQISNEYKGSSIQVDPTVIPNYPTDNVYGLVTISNNLVSVNAKSQYDSELVLQNF
jgi:hypothetical protein